jgi:hypothetical protein
MMSFSEHEDEPLDSMKAINVLATWVTIVCSNKIHPPELVLTFFIYIIDLLFHCRNMNKHLNSDFLRISNRYQSADQLLGTAGLKDDRGCITKIRYL